MDSFQAVYGYRPVLTPKDADMITLPSRKQGRDDCIFAHLSKLLPKASSAKPSDDEIVRIFDAYAGAGGDCIHFSEEAFKRKMHIRIVCTQNSDPNDCRLYGDEKDPQQNRYVRLGMNQNLIFSINGHMKRKLVGFLLCNEPVQNFILTQLTETKYFRERTDCLYCDPPWMLPEGFDLGKDQGTEHKPSAATTTLIKRLEKEVFGPLHKIRYPCPSLICIKAPTPFQEFRVALFETSPYLRAYALLETIPVRNRRGSICMYFHVLAPKEGPLLSDTPHAPQIPNTIPKK